MKSKSTLNNFWVNTFTILSYRNFLAVIKAATTVFFVLHFMLGLNGFSKSPLCSHAPVRRSWTRDWSIFVCSGLLVAFCLQLNRVFLSTFRQENTLGTLSTYYATIGITFIGVVSQSSAFLFDWGGVCRDSFGVEMNATMLLDWIFTIPLLTFITVSVDDKPFFSRIDHAAIWMQFVSMILIAVTTISTNRIVRQTAFVFYIISLFPLYQVSSQSYSELKCLITRSTENPTRKSLLERRVLLFSRKTTMAACLVLLFPLIPVIYMARVFNVVNADLAFVGFMFTSAFTKIFFASVCMDAHLEVSHPVIALIDAEKFAHTTRRAFLRYVFHEVRVPLNSIALGIQLLSSSKEVSSSDLETITVMKEAVSFMGETLNDVMALQTIEDGSLELLLKPFTIKDLFCNIEHSFADIASDMEVQVRTIVDENVPEVLIGDKYRLRHVIANLVSNAVKYSNARSEVIIRASVAKDMTSQSIIEPVQPLGEFIMVVFTVEDHGKGISKEDQEEDIFQPYRALKHGDLKEGRGTGLGLAICKEIVHMHGGEISYRSTLGVGTTFYVHIPLEVFQGDVSHSHKSLRSKFLRGKGSLDSHYNILTLAGTEGRDYSSSSSNSSLRAERLSLSSFVFGSKDCHDVKPVQVNELFSNRAPSQIEEQKILESKDFAEEEMKTEVNRHQEQTGSEEEKSRQVGDIRVLVVDDVESNRKFLKKLLELKGLRKIELANDGVQAVESVESAMNLHRPFDIIFMDNTMPNMTGVDATRKLRLLGYPNLIIGLTANCMEDELNEFKQSGSDLVLTKPMKSNLIEFLIQLILHSGSQSYFDDSPPKSLLYNDSQLTWESVKSQ